MKTDFGRHRSKERSQILGPLSLERFAPSNTLRTLLYKRRLGTEA
mgnify:CR=1 FL=1